MAAPPRKVKRKGGSKMKRKGRRDEELDSVGEGPSKAIGELVVPFSERLDFGSPVAAFTGEKEAADARALAAPELPELRTSLRGLSQRIASLRTAAESLAQRLSGEEAETSGEPAGSAAYMDMKVQMMLSYVVGLTYYLLLKARGVPVRDHPVALRLLWLRTLLEKLRPVDQRLQYQMNKLLQAAEAAAGVGAAADPRALRPGELATTVEDAASADEDEEDDRRGAQEEDDGIYRPPRISQVEYTGDHITSKERAEKDMERQKRRFENSDMVRSLREEFTDAPAEIRGDQRSNAEEKAMRKMKEQTSYEEENMVRLRSTRDEKKEKQRLFRAQRASSGGAVSLHDMSNLNDIAAAIEGGKGSKGKGGKGKGRRGESALQSFQGAEARVRQARSVVDSVAGGAMPEGMGTFKRGRSGGGDDGGGKGGKRGSKQQRFL